jgi:hypothetical protein
MPGFLRLRTIVLALLLASACALSSAGQGTPADDSKDVVPKPPPKDVKILFEGTDLSKWVKYEANKKNDVPRSADWKVEKGYMEIVPGRKDIMTKEKFGPDFQLHVEFWLPLMADKKGQQRADSGIFLHGRHEIQVLDSHDNPTYPEYSCGALYGLIAPSKNASRPPRRWQIYDITFHAPRIDERTKTVKEKGELTVVLNGETIIEKAPFDKVTAGAMDDKIGTPGPIRLQDHGAKVRYRNIWIKPLLPVR